MAGTCPGYRLSWLVWIARGFSHEVAAASVVVACYRHFVANQCWAIRYRGLTPTAICYRHFVASLDRKSDAHTIGEWRQRSCLTHFSCPLILTVVRNPKGDGVDHSIITNPVVVIIGEEFDS